MTTDESAQVLSAKYDMIDVKLRDGQWWARAIVTLKPRNSGPAETIEATGATLGEALAKVAQ